jgi:2-polyprenyl-6-methoxyphenol hydroxylase-like FAD-dependent oxidoreductase
MALNPAMTGSTHKADIAIVGGGLAGSMAALVLGRAGYNVALIDIHAAYPPDFRCEKFANEQIDLLRGLGLFDEIAVLTTPVPEMVVARFGRLVERTGRPEYGFAYEHVVNALRAKLPRNVAFIVGRAAALATGRDRQRATLSSGEVIEARLIVLATGLGDALRQGLGIARHVIRDRHSLSAGFDVAPAPGETFGFPALTYFGERTAERMAYVSFFPIGDAMRVNLFCYRGHDGEWAKAFKSAPRATLFAAMPGLRRFVGDFQTTGKVKIRVVDLQRVENVRRDGVVLVGDAFQTTCPAAGNGVTRVLTDVDRLCNTHVPRWLASAGMGAEKIAQFYDDDVKVECDRKTAHAAEYCRHFSINDGPFWRARRWRAYLRPRARAWIARARSRVGGLTPFSVQGRGAKPAAWQSE